MISFDVTVTGQTVLRKLCDDEEEFAYALMNICDEVNPSRIGRNTAEFFYGPDEKKNVAKWLRDMADAIEGAGE